ncbi:neurochondrin homolog isoform X1 [Cucurbita maxima]|uniref:Neurochondrin homolog isoform X1 n=1 Tax=Cucurbita maxima TaxID=3661 RepID=A0A6J1IL84_CUCMA|nr:neurochondrin homolog isoform X1 [Cucurbita maxima]
MELQQEQTPSVSIEDCLKLLKGEKDEQRLVGLFLVTKICKVDDIASLTRVYNAVGAKFLDRLLRTGMGKGTVSGPGEENRDAYLQLSVRILVAFCHVPDIAASEEMISKIPLLLEILSNQSGSSVLEECLEFLYLVSTTSDAGVTVLYKSGSLKIIASWMSKLADGSHPMKIFMQLVQLIISKISLDIIIINCLPELTDIVVDIARLFGVSHDAMKFEALHLLSAILSSNLTPLYDALRQVPSDVWSKHMRNGVSAILHNRTAPAEKLQALSLAESMVYIRGEGWLIGEIELPDVQDAIPSDRCLILVLEQSRVEIAVMLNELAYAKYEASKNSSLKEDIIVKQRNVATAFSLVEKIIKLVSNVGEDQGDLIDENTLMKVFRGLNETTGVVLEYLQDAKEHGQRKGDDILASVRVIGSFLAQTPDAWTEKVKELLDYMLSVEGEDEQSPFNSVCFLLPMLCQITMNVEGCKTLVSSGGLAAVVKCLINLIHKHGGWVDNDGSIFLACDTILNVLLKKELAGLLCGESSFVHLLEAIANSTEDAHEPSVIMMAASICALVFDYTSENALLSNPNFADKSLDKLCRLFSRIFALSQQQSMNDDERAQMDLYEIIAAGYSRWGDRFPRVRKAIVIAPL